MKPLSQYLQEKGIEYEIFERPESHHAHIAADDLGVDLRLFVKSLVVLDQDKNPYMALVPGTMMVDYKKLKKILNVKKVRLCPFDDAHLYSGFPPGATPPVHHKVEMKVIMDKRILENEWAYGGGGEKNLTIKLKVSDIIHFNDAQIEDIVVEEKEEK